MLSPRLHQPKQFPAPAAGNDPANQRKLADFSVFLRGDNSGTLPLPNQDRGGKTLLRKLTVSEAAYLAGIVDGEGTITLTRMHRGENRRPVVSISSTELPLLLYVRSVVGAGRITNKARARSCHSPSYAYTLLSRQALLLLGQISKYLRTYKAKRARLLLEDYLRVTPRNGRYTDARRRAKQSLEDRFFAISVRPIPSRRDVGPVRGADRAEQSRRP